MIKSVGYRDNADNKEGRAFKYGPILHSTKWEFIGTAYPWYVFKPLKPGVPELRYLSSAIYVDDETGERTYYQKKLPRETDY